MGTSGALELEWKRRESLGAVVRLSSTSQLGTHWWLILRKFSCRIWTWKKVSYLFLWIDSADDFRVFLRGILLVVHMAMGMELLSWLMCRFALFYGCDISEHFEREKNLFESNMCGKIENSTKRERESSSLVFPWVIMD